MVDYLIFGEFDSRNYNLVVGSSENVSPAKKSFSTEPVLNRVGHLFIDDDEFLPKTVKYTCILSENLTKIDPVAALDEIKSILYSTKGLNKLQDSDNENHFFMAKFNGDISVTRNLRNKNFVFSLSFLRQPQKFLIEGTREIESPSALTNPTRFESYPLIKFTATSESGNIMLGEFSLSFSGADQNQQFIFDCEKLNASSPDGENLNDKAFVETDLKLLPGANSISVEGIGEYSIEPRWWTI